MAKAKTPARTPITKEAWARLGEHTITLWSGAEVTIRYPDVVMLIAGESMPEHLRAILLQQLEGEIMGVAEAGRGPGGEPAMGAPRFNTETLVSYVEVNRWLVSAMLVEPAMTPEETQTIPPRDFDLILEIGKRERDRDARGVKLGVKRLQDFDSFRHHHACPETCPSCEAVIEELSTIRMDKV
jgi:hypothetical protein